jgi:hypothetical protein
MHNDFDDLIILVVTLVALLLVGVILLDLFIRNQYTIADFYSQLHRWFTGFHEVPLMLE